MTALTPQLTRLMSNARVHVPGALDDMLKLELFNVLDLFLQQTNFWQEEVVFVGRADRTSYDISGSESGKVISLLGIVNENDSPVAGTMLEAGTVILSTAPNEGDEFTATVAFTVADPVDRNDYPNLPDGLLDKYHVGILAGLVGRMMAQPSKPYTNERLGIFNTRQFVGAIANARAAVMRKNLHGGQAWRFPQFAPGSQR